MKKKFEKGQEVVHEKLGEGVFVSYDLFDGEAIVEFTDELRVSVHLLRTKE